MKGLRGALLRPPVHGTLANPGPGRHPLVLGMCAEGQCEPAKALDANERTGDKYTSTWRRGVWPRLGWDA